MQQLILPDKLLATIGDESRNFEVRAGRLKPLKEILSIFLFGLIWTGISFVQLFYTVSTVLEGESLTYMLNGLPVTSDPAVLSTIATPVLGIGVFVLFGLFMLVLGVFYLITKGPIFIGTPTRLLLCYKDKVNDYSWAQFSKIEVSGNDQKGSIVLRRRFGPNFDRKNRPKKKLNISGITHVKEIEQICRQRIRENDPALTK